MDRRLEIKVSVLSHFSLNCGAGDATKAIIRTSLKELAAHPDNGYRIPFDKPLFYQLPVGDYRINYTFDNNTVKVLYIGKPGVC